MGPAAPSTSAVASLIVAPLKVRGQRIGVVGAWSGEPVDYRAADRLPVELHRERAHDAPEHDDFHLAGFPFFEPMVEGFQIHAGLACLKELHESPPMLSNVSCGVNGRKVISTPGSGP